jgi:secreted trypsin-like serine protease
MDRFARLLKGGIFALLTQVTVNFDCVSLGKVLIECFPSSGGPIFLTKTNYIFNIGIVSYGTACASNSPSTNTRVASYLDWIMSNTKSTVYCVK